MGGISGAVDGFFTGVLQDVRVYPAALNPRSILAHVHMHCVCAHIVALLLIFE